MLYTTQKTHKWVRNPLKDQYMNYSKFEEQYKNYEQAVERVVQSYEFWFHSIISTAKTYFTQLTK